MINIIIISEHKSYMGKYFDVLPRLFSTGGAEPYLVQDTISNLSHAITLGADVIRTNIGLTADNKIVLYSNDLFNVAEPGVSGIGSYSLNELRSKYANILRSRAVDGSKDDIDGVFPELEEVLTEFPEQRFNVNCPDRSLALMQRFKEIIDRLEAQDRILVSSVSGYNTRWIRKEMPGVPVTFSFYGMIGFYFLFKSGLIFVTGKFATPVLIIPEMIGASFFANSGLIEQARKRGIRVYVDPINTERQARRIKEAGADGIITNDLNAVKPAFRD